MKPTVKKQKKTSPVVECVNPEEFGECLKALKLKHNLAPRAPGVKS